MTHTSTEQPEALRLADTLDLLAMDLRTPRAAAKELRRLHARVQELEASQEQCVPLSDEQIAEACGWKAGLGCKPLPRELQIARAIETAHGITQEKQG